MGRKRGRQTTATTPGCRKPRYSEATALLGPCNSLRRTTALGDANAKEDHDMGPTAGQGAGREVAQPGKNGQRRPSHLGKAATVTAALVGLVFMAGACSGGPKSPGVAATGTTATANRASSKRPSHRAHWPR